MTTVDTLLKNVYHNSDKLSLIPKRDIRIIASLTHQIQKGAFLTENQSKLLVKIFKENLSSIETIDDDAKTIIKNNQWSSPFRVIQKIRKIYQNPQNLDSIVVEFTYDKRIKERLMTLNSKLDGNISADGPKHYSIQLTEKNIFMLVKELIRFDFEIEEKILDFFREIEKIVETPTSSFLYNSLDNKKLKEMLKNDIGDNDCENPLLIHDRKIRHQYHFYEKIDENSLSAKIALREKSKIFIDNNKASFDSLIKSLIELKRFPALVIFDGHESKINKKCLDLLKNTLESNKLANDVGIYFRFNKEADSDGFNSSVGTYGFNKNLTTSTTVAGIANNKIPKFMIKMGWKPKSVISFTNNFRMNKSSVYCNDVDLIIYFNDKAPLNKDTDAIL